MQFSVKKHKVAATPKIIPTTQTHSKDLKVNYYHHLFGQCCENCTDDLDTQLQSKDKSNYRIGLEKKAKKCH